MDMTLAFFAKMLGEDVSQQAAKFAEYNGQWSDPSDDPWGSTVCCRANACDLVLGVQGLSLVLDSCMVLEPLQLQFETKLPGH